MKQVVQNYKTGELSVEDVPAPICRAGGVVVRTAYSLISVGTERMKVKQARMNLVQMAKARPDKVQQVLQSVKQVGLKETYHKVRERLDTLTPLGYSLAGTVVEMGRGVDDYSADDRVACAGEGLACHAEYVFVPRNLCVPVPDSVELKDAAFSTVGAIAMNGVRQAGVTIGDSVLVIGLGLVGLLAVQILKAAGCRVIGVDLDASKVESARHCGACVALARDDAALEDTIRHVTDGLGVDVAYIAASTRSADPMELSGRVVRDRGRVVIVGMVPVQADWQTYYRKELSVRLSRSYGPGRYDRNFEQKGIDYPVGYVRWTERRNLLAFLHLIGSAQVDLRCLEPTVYKLEEAARAYQNLHDSPAGQGAAILFEYPTEAPCERRVTLHGDQSLHGEIRHRKNVSSRVGIGLIGAGHFATGTLIPVLKTMPQARLRAICSAGGLSAKSAARRHGFEYCTSDYRALLNDDEIDAVVIATRHDTHASFSADALRADKHVFVEKPLALTHEQLDEVIQAQTQSGHIVMPGFNRRFSPLSIAVRDFFAQRASPIEVICRVNAGSLNSDSWYQDPEEGGWRIISEGCHFIDLIQFLCGCPPLRVSAEMVGSGVVGERNDNCTAVLKMEDGSLATLVYVANGDSRFEKERIEVFGQQRVGVIENWRVARLCSQGRTRKVGAGGSGKGHGNELRAFVEAVRTGGASPLPWDEAVTCTLATLAVAQSLGTGRAVIPSQRSSSLKKMN